MLSILIQNEYPACFWMMNWVERDEAKLTWKEPNLFASTKRVALQAQRSGFDAFLQLSSHRLKGQFSSIAGTTSLEY